MESLEVKLFLSSIGVSSTELLNNNSSIPREEIIQKLMNVTLQCLGAIRLLVVEEEKIRVAEDCCDIDGTSRNDGKRSRLSRVTFSDAVKAMTETIVTAQELDNDEPMKDLIEAYPWHHSMNGSGWYMLNWAIMSTDILTKNMEWEIFQVNTVDAIMESYPQTVNEIDKKGQHYVTYAIKTNSMPLLEMLIKQNKDCVRYKDGTGKLPLHICARYSQSVEMLYCILDNMTKSLSASAATYIDDDGNLPLHFAASGPSSTAILSEILFSFTEATKIPNKDGKLPLHLAASESNVEKLKAILASYPVAVSTPDNNGWIPLLHAAFACKSIEIIKTLYEAYPEGISKPHKSGRLPIHYAAVTCNSSKVLKFLIDLYPEGVKVLDINRRLPLHNSIARCVFMNPARLRCIRLLLEAYPYAVNMAGNDDRTPLDLARRDGQGDLVIRLLLRADPDQDPDATEEMIQKEMANRKKYRSKVLNSKDRIISESNIGSLM